MANKLMEFARKAAIENEKKKKKATTSGAKATAIKQNNNQEKKDTGYHAGSPSLRMKSQQNESDMAKRGALTIDSAVRDWGADRANAISSRQTNKNAGTTHTPVSGRRHNYKPQETNKEILQKVHTQHQELAKQTNDWATNVHNESQQKLQKAKEGLSPLGQFGVDVGYGATQMGLDLGTAALFGGGGAAYFTSMGMGAYGNGYNQAKQGGASDTQAQVFGLANAGVEILTEKLFAVGGALKNTMGKGLIDVEKLMKLGTADIVKSSAGREFSQGLAKFGLTAGTEGAEEFLSGMIQPVLQKYIYSNENLDLKQMLGSALYQGAIGAALGAGFGAVDVNTQMQAGKFLQDNDTIAAVVEEGLTSRENTKAYKLAEKVAKNIGNGIEPTSFELNQLHRENIKAIQEEQREDEKVKSVTDKAIEKNVGKEFIVDVKDIDGVSGYYNEAQQKGADLDIPVKVKEYSKIKESVSRSMAEKIKAANMEGTGEAETQSIARILIGQADARDFTRLYPTNKIAREVFEQETGQALPGTNAETREFLLNYNENMRVAAANMEKNPSSLYVKENAINAYRRAGEMGLPMATVTEKYGNTLSEQEQQRAYESGQNKTVEKEVKAKTQEPKKNRSTVRTESDYGLFDETSTKEKSDIDDAVDKFAKKMKLKVIKKDSIKTADGKAANGYYENGVIVIAKNSTLPFDKVFSHELWHHLKQVSPKNAEALESFVKKEFFGNDAIKYDNELKRLGKLYGNQDDTFLFEEFMSDQVHELLSDPTLTQKLATENKGLAQAIIDFINQFIDAIKTLFGNTNSGDFFAQLGIKEEAVQMLADTIKGIDTKAEVKTENAEPKYQISDKLSADLDKVLNNTMGENEEVYVGTTSKFLVDGIGVKSLNVTMPVLKAYAAMVSKDQAIAENRYHSNTEYHNLGSDLLVKALKSSEDPIMAYYQITTTKKGVKVGRIVLITPEKDNAGKTIVVVEEINTRGLVNGKGEDVNKVITVHDRTSISALVKDAVVNNLVLYSDKKRISTIAAVPEVQFLHNMNDAFYGYNIQHFWEEVNYEKTKPKEKPYEPATSTALGDKLNAAMKNKEGKFSLSEPVEMKDGLIAVHNLSETSLKESLNLGGFPMPSIAIVTPELGHDNFGDISVIFGRDTVDPSYDVNRVYSGDAWTPTFPQVDVELNQKSLDKLRDKLTSVNTQRFNDGHVDYDGDNFKSHYNNAGSMEKYADNNYDLKLAYLQEIGEPYGKFPVRYEKHGYESGGQIADEDVIKLSEKMPEEFIGEFSKMKFFDASKFAKEHADEIIKIVTDTIGQTDADSFSVLLAIKKYRNGYEPTTTEYPDVTRARIEVDDRIDSESYHSWVNDILKNVFVKKGIRNNRETFTSSGSRRSFDTLHYEFTLENLVRAMKEEPENGNQPWGVSAGFLKGKLAKRFKSVQEIKDNIDKLNDDDTVKLAYDELNNSIMDIVTRMTDRYINTHPDENSFIVTDNAASALVEAAESAKTPTAIKRVFDQYSYQISYTNELIDDVIALFNATIDLPVRLFESKPRRAVELDEIKLVVLPKETSQSLVDELQSKNIPVDFYDPSIEGDRVEKVNSHSEIRFQLQESQDADRLRIRQKIEELQTLLSQEDATNKGLLPDIKTRDALVRKLRTDYNSEIKPSELVAGLNEIYKLLKSGKKNLETAFETSHELAKDIVSQGGVLNTETEKDYKALKEYMRTKPLKIEDEHKGDFGKGEWNRFRKSMFGKLNLTDSGQTIDSFYKDEILPLFPGHLDPELTHPTDILNHVLEVIDELAPSFDTFDINSYTGREMVDMVQLDILDAMFGMDPQKPLSANQRRNKYQNILESIDKATGEYANKTAQQLQDEKAKYQSMLSDLEVSEANRRIEQKKRYDELMAELVKERDEQLKLLKLKGDEKLKKQEELFRKRLEKTKARFYEQRTKGEMMDSIKRNADYLAEALIHPTDTKHIPEGYQRAVAEVLNGLDFESTHTDAWEKRMGTPGKRVMRLRKLARQYEDILDGKEESFAEFDEEMRPLIRTLSDTLDSEDGGKRLSELDNEELNTVRVILKHLRHVISTSNRAFNDRIKETYSELGESIINEMSTSKMKKEYSGLWGSVGQFFGEQIVAPTDFFALAGGTLNRLYYEVRKGFDKHINNVTDAMSYIDSAMEGLNRKDVKKWSEGYGKATTFTLSDGSQIQLLQSQIMSLYALNKREQARGHIYGSGIVVAPLSVKEKGLKEKLAKTHRMVTESDVSMILASLTDEQKSLANKLLRFISTTTSEWGNETSMKLYGIKKYTETDYFPIKSDKAFLMEQFEVKGDPKLKNMGFTKSTVDLANNPIVIDDFFNVITNHITQMSMYNALVPALTDFERVYNYTHKEGGRQTNSVKNMIQGTMGQKGIAYISRFMQNVNGSYNREYGIEWAEKLLSGFKKSALGMNMRVLVQQPTSLIRASMVIDHAYLLEGMAQKTIGNATRKEMWNHVPIARWKSWGYAQTDVSREQKDIMLGNTNMLDTITMGAYGFADDISWTVLYAAVKAETKDKHPELEFDTPEYWEHIVDRFNEVVDKTQVVDSVFHRTEIMREKTFFKKTLTSFMPEPLKLYNMVRTQLFLANKEMKEGNSGEAAKMYARIGISLIPYFAVLTAVQSIMDTIRRSWTGEDDDDEKSYWELFQINFWDNLIDNVNPMNMLPFFRDVWSSISGYDVKRPDMAILTNMADDVKRLVSYFDEDKESPYTMTYITRKLAEDMVSFFGVPLKNLTREIESATWGIMSAMGYTQAAIYFRNKMKFKVLEKKSDNIDLYLKAELLGDPKDAKMIYDDLKKKGITEKDITDRIKYTYGKEFRTALESGLFITAKATIDTMVSAGVSREDLVNSVRNSVGEYYKEAFASGKVEELDKYDEVLAKVGYTETDLANYRYGYAKGYAKYQVYVILQESGESAAYQEAEKWVSDYPGIYESADSLMYGIERSADSTKSDWDEGKWRKDSFDKFE